MVYRVFISHSTKDLDIVYDLHRWLTQKGIVTYVAEFYPRPGLPLPEKIAKEINECDCVIALLTVDGNRSEFVQQEIGYAKKAGKLIIPLVEEGLVKPRGFLEGVEYIPFRRDFPTEAILRVSQYLQELSVRKEEEQKSRVILACMVVLLGLIGLAAAATSVGEGS